MSTNGIKKTISPRKKRLKTAQDCRRYLADLVHRLDSDEVDATKAGRLGYLVNLILSAVRTDELEDRLSALEQAVQEKRT